jgi:hypothetical protein
MDNSDEDTNLLGLAKQLKKIVHRQETYAHILVCLTRTVSSWTLGGQTPALGRRRKRRGSEKLLPMRRIKMIMETRQVEMTRGQKSLMTV